MSHVAPWIEAEFEGAELGDTRLQQRLLTTVDAISRRPDQSFPHAFDTVAGLEGFYRFVNNDAVRPDAMLEPHADQTWKRARGREGATLVLHDTTELSYGGEKHRRGLTKKGHSQSLILHLGLAVAETEAPVVHGVAAHGFYAREGGAWIEVGVDEERELLVGSERWHDMVRRSWDLAPDDVEVVHVADREADDFIFWVTVVDHGHDFVVRGRQNPRVEGADEARSFELVDEQPVKVVRAATLSRRGSRRRPGSRQRYPDRDRRFAKLALSATTVVVERPEEAAPQGDPHMELGLVKVEEVDAPEGEEPVVWRLWTTLPVQTTEQIARVVDIYCRRWLVEEYFKALKTGCAAEKRGAQTADSLTNVLALLMPVAWRLLRLRAVARDLPDAPAKLVLDGVELQALAHLTKRSELAKKGVTCRQALLGVARLGGHLKSNGEPGWQVLGRGLERLLDFAVGWRAALAAVGMAAEDEM